MWSKLNIWWTALDSGWKTFMAVIAFVTTISTIAIKVNKGIELMTETANNVKLLVKNDTIQSKDIAIIKAGLNNEEKLRNAQNESFVDFLKLENKLDMLVKHYEKMSKAQMQENEKKNLIP